MAFEEFSSVMCKHLAEDGRVQWLFGISTRRAVSSRFFRSVSAISHVWREMATLWGDRFWRLIFIY